MEILFISVQRKCYPSSAANLAIIQSLDTSVGTSWVGQNGMHKQVIKALILLNMHYMEV